MASQLSILNPRPRRLSGPSYLHSLVRQNAADDVPALDYVDADGSRQQLSYAELHHSANELATRIHTLRRERASRPTEPFIVPVFIGQCPHLYITQLAILKAGGAFCPITLDVPEERLRFILQDVGANMLITTTELRDHLPDLGDLTVVAADAPIKHGDAALARVNLDPSMPAYVMYTSGSTGQPKGVVLSHSAATQALLAHDRHIPNFSRFLQFASPTFDVSVFEIFFPLFRGRTLVCCERKRLLNDLPGVITSLDVDAAELTPSVANSLLHGRESVPTLKVLLTIGEMLKQSVVEDFGGSSKENAVLHGMYGPTEATIHCTLQPSFAKDMPVGSIGIPLDTVSAFIIRPASDDHPSQMVDILPIGEEGELAVGGHQLADGYLHRDEQTKAAFISHPTYGRLYRTGDRAKIDGDGRLLCSGRISSGQVKLRGQRIEMGEIEYAASRTPGCKSVVADVIAGSLVAFCVSNSREITELQVQETCKKWLPAFMVPTDVHFLNSLPMLASGKVDKNAMQAHHRSTRDAQSGASDKSHDQETLEIAGVIDEILNTNVLSLSTLAATSLDSLSSIKIATAFRKKGFPQISATDVLEARTLDDLKKSFGNARSHSNISNTSASLLGDEEVRRAVQAHDILSGQMENIDEILACSPAQVAMLGETAKSSQAYCNWVELAVDPTYDFTTIDNALHRLSELHDLLRAGFAALDHPKHPYATVVWKPENVPRAREVTTLERDFFIDKDIEMLQPPQVQIRHGQDETSVLLQLHHAVYDQWSMDLLKADLASLLENQDLSIRPSFAAVSAFHNANIAKSASHASIDFWENHLRSAVATVLPQMNGTRAPPLLHRTTWRNIDLSSALVKDQARKLGSSAHSIFQAAFAFLLSYYVGSSDVLYGTVFSGRQISVHGIEQIFGPCLATLPSRLDLSEARTFQDLVRAAHDRNRAMLKHSDTPLIEVKKAGQFAPDSTMFDTLFVWQESTVTGSKVVRERDSADYHEFNLVLEVDPSDEQIAIRVTSRQNRISSEQVDAFVQQLAYIAKQLIKDPTDQVVDLGKRLPKDALSVFNPRPRCHQYQQGLVATLEQVALQRPSLPALVFGQSLSSSDVRLEKMTYYEMHTRANQLAAYLISVGVKPNNLVCICMEKSLELYTAILAVLKAGAGYLPLIPETPVERIRSILDQAQVNIALCDSVTTEDVRSTSTATAVNLTELGLSSFSRESPQLPYCGSDAAYAVFTSGTTGEPKGLIVTQENLLGNLAALSDIYLVESGDRLLQACSQAFDVSVFEIFFALFKGMPLCFAQKDTLFGDLEHAIRTLEITHLSLTPTVAALIDPANVPAVRFLVTAGEPMTDVVHQRWAGKRLYQGYGPSETTNICTINPSMPDSDIIANIGLAFPNTSAFIIHATKPFEMLPFGAVGELAFGGEQVFRGYIGRESLNAEKILEHPEYGKLYRSGDIGRMLPSGTILISGRLDDQVKIRGNRVELGEINCKLLQDENVQDCTSLIIGEDAASQYLASFWVPQDPAKRDTAVVPRNKQVENNVAQLFESLESSLPSYMIPSAIIPMTNLPLTGQGKLDKRMLKKVAMSLDSDAKTAYYRSSAQTQEDDKGEWSPLERELASILESILDLAAGVGRTTSFFSLGLNSINAIAYTKVVSKKLHRHATVSKVLRNPSIARLAQALSNSARTPESSVHEPTQAFSSTTFLQIKEAFDSESQKVLLILPCTPLQEAMLSAGDSRYGAAYSNKTTFEFYGDLHKIRHALEQLVLRHEILRTQFVETDEADHPFAQVVLERIELPWIQSTHNDNTNGSKAREEDVPSVSFKRPLCITADMVDGKVLISLHMHHAIYDGQSMEVMLEEAEQLYRGHSLPAAPTFKPFLDEVQRQASSRSITAWSDLIKDYRPKPFPSVSASEEISEERQNQTLQINQDDIVAFCKRHNVTTLSVLQAAWAKVLSHVQRADDICYGDVMSGRSVPVSDVDRLVAPCFNTVPVRVNIGRCNSNLDVVRLLQNQRITVEAHQLTPLRRIQAQSLTPARHLFDSLMLVQPPSRALDASMWSIRSDEGLMDLPLVIEITQNGHHLDLSLHYSTRYVSSDLAAAIIGAFDESLTCCIRHPSSDSRAIPEIELALLDGKLASEIDEDDFSAPQAQALNEEWSEQESMIRRILSDISKASEDKIHRHTSLFQLGLDSLNAVQVASRLRSQGMQIDAADVMEYRTPAALASATAKRQSGSQHDEKAFDLSHYDHEHRSSVLASLHIRDQTIEAIWPCTAAQNGMLSQSIQTHGELYINHITYAVPDDISAVELHDALKAVQHRHQALRMGFHQTDEARCPFAMIIYHQGDVDMPLSSMKLSETRQAEVAAEIVDTKQRPAWRAFVSITKDERLLTLSLHHALYDAESLQILLADIDAALMREQPISTSNIDPILSTMLAGRGPESKDFWQSSLEHASFSTFPNLYPSNMQASGLSAVHRASQLSGAELEHLCKANECTIQAAGQAAWAILVSAYIGESGVTIGTVFSDRTGSKHDGTIFPSLSTVPVFCDTTRSSSEVIAGMVHFNSIAQRHKYTPLSDIQRYANCTERSLFDTVFVYQKSAHAAGKETRWKVLRQSAAVDYAASLELETNTHGMIDLSLTVMNSVIPEAHAELLLEQYDHVLQHILKNDGILAARSTELYSMTPAKQPTLPAPVHLLHEFVERGANQHPDKQALEFIWSFDKSAKSRKTWSYRQLNERANQVAHLLLQQDLEPGQIVALRMQKCPEASFAFIGILKAGCAFLAIDPELPPARQKFILEDSAAAMLLVDTSTDVAKEEHVTKTIHLHSDVLDHLPTAAVDIRATGPQSTCYCLYTSGTTGTPKGCELTHENAVQFMMSFQRMFAGHWDEHSRWLQFASYWFDVSVLEQFWPWGVGMAVVGAPRDLVLEDLAQFIQKMRITHIDLTPSLARLLEPEDVPSLWKGVFITGGEALKQEIVQKWGKYKVICNGYGPTEATIGVTMNPFIGAEAKPSNIGPQFDNVGSYVFAPGTTDPVLRGAVGELCVSGKLVGKGYLNRQELTSKQFPTLRETGEKIYRTGDLVRQLADGSFAFIGRQDSQAKLRGQRLEIDEIDSVVRGSSFDIADVASLVVKGSDDRQTLVTFFITAVRKQRRDVSLDVSDQAREATHTALQACRTHLPGYMVPTHILPVNIIPLTVNNKVDAKRLTAFFNGLPSTELQSVKHGNSADRALGQSEMKIVEVIATMFPIDASTIIRSTNLFSVGLSSVSAITFASLLKRNGFATASVATIMRNPDIGQLSDALSETGSEGSVDENSIRQAQLSLSAFHQRYRHLAASRLAVNVEDIEVVAPCTPLQQGLLLESSRSESRPYFNTFRYQADHVDLPKLRKAFQRVADEVQPLRTKFTETDDGYIQVVLHKQKLPWSFNEDSGTDAPAMIPLLRGEWISRNEQDFASPFEIAVRVSPSGTLLIINVHHALYDGISFDLMMDRVARAYRGDKVIDCGRRFIESLPFGPLREQGSAKLFWEQQLSGLRSSHFPILYGEKPGTDPAIFRQFGYGISFEETRKALGVSHQAMAQACFAIALHQLAPDTSVYGLVVSGRSIAFDGADKILGPLFNTIPSPLDLRSTDRWADLIQRCHDFNAAVLPHQHTPLRSIKKWCDRGSSTPMFNVLFTFQHALSPSSVDEQAFWKPIEEPPRAEYPLAVEVELTDDGCLAVTLVAKRTNVNHHILQEMLDRFGKALTLIAQDPNQSVKDHFHVADRKNSRRSPSEDSPAPCLNGVHDFTWSPSADIIRSEIARLASLHDRDVDEHTSIFSLGLDSIDAVKLMSRLRKSDMSISVSELIRAQTIPRILKSLETRARNNRSAERPSLLAPLEQELSKLLRFQSSLDHDQIERILPATPTQEALVAEMIRSDFQEYFNHDVLRLSPKTSLDQLKRAWQETVNRSPILRTSFVEVETPDIDAVFAQVIHKPGYFVVDEVSTDSNGDLRHVLKGIGRSARTQFNTRPLTRITIVSTQQETYLVLSLAHAQYDGHSLALLHQDVQSIYLQHQVPKRPDASPVIEASLAAVDQDALSFWREIISGARTKAFRQCPTASKTNGDVHRAELKSAISVSDAKAFCQEQGISLQVLAQTCWAVTLAYYTGHLEVMFGIVLACRDSEAAEQIMFPMMNTVVMRASLHGTRAQMLQHMQSVSTDILNHQRTPLRSIQAACTDTTVLDSDGKKASGLFDTLFIYQHRPQPEAEPSEPLYESIDGSSNIEYPVAVEMEAVGEDLLLRTACRSSIFDGNGTEQLLATLDGVLKAIVAAPQQPTVELRDSEATICGLPPVEVEIAALDADSSTSEIHTDSATSDELDGSGLVIRDALSQVSRIPIEDFSPASTIESIGIDSISAIKVVALLRRRGVKITVSDILRERSLGSIAEIARNKTAGTASDENTYAQTVSRYLTEHKLDQLDRANVQVVLPALAGQIYMIQTWRLSGGQLFYPTLAYQLSGEVSVDGIRKAWKSLVHQHDILRTVFVGTESAEVPLLQLVLKETTDNFITGQIASESSDTQPMARLQATKSASQWDLKLTIHHALYDAVSLPLIMDDLQRLIAGDKLQTQPVRFEDFIALSLPAEARKASKDFWTHYLGNAKPLRLQQPAKEQPKKRVEVFKPGLFRNIPALEALARKKGISTQALLFAAYAKVYTGLAKSAQDGKDVVLGIYLSNRSHLDKLSSLRAPTLNLVPLLVRSPTATTLIESAKQLHQDLQAISTAERSAVALWEIEQWTGVMVDYFVNFLKLPDADEDEGRSDNAVSIEDANDLRLQERSELVDHDKEAEFEMPEGLRKLPELKAYQHSVDIEATIANGTLDMGLFCPETMLGLQEAEEVFSDVKKALEDLVD